MKVDVQTLYYCFKHFVCHLDKAPTKEEIQGVISLLGKKDFQKIKPKFKPFVLKYLEVKELYEDCQSMVNFIAVDNILRKDKIEKQLTDCK